MDTKILEHITQKKKALDYVQNLSNDYYLFIAESAERSLDR